MIRDLLQGRADDGVETDVCVVGAGAAGIVLALELMRSGKTVTLLEAGGRLMEQISQEPIESVSVGLHHRGLETGRVRALGGTTTLWGGQILELDALDFESRSWIEESGWPIRKSELSPFYERALSLEGLAGTIRDDDVVWSQVNERRPIFPSLEAYLSRWCPEPDFARLHRDALEKSTMLQVWLHANVIELLMQGDAAQGVRCRTTTGIESTFRAKLYCFALGTIESSRFFLQPRQGQLPWNESGLLGKHFQDHIDCDAAVVHPKSGTAFHGLFDAIFVGGLKYNPKVKWNSETQQELQLLNAGATFYTASTTDDHLPGSKQTAKHILRGRIGELRVGDLWSLLKQSPTLLRQAYRYGIEHRAYHPPGAEIRMRVHCEQQPTSASWISLAESKDAFGLQQTKLNWEVSELELKTIAAFVDTVVRRDFTGLAEIVPDPDLGQLGERFRQKCQDGFHHMGGMRMHPSPRRGVVDQNLKLHGTSNTYVCSCAVFPSSGFSNPTHTLLALAVRLADHLTNEARPTP